ncbi:DUF397 domain-containing protein [Streptomyces adelaidensis]|uniref:DUF397 domain-containing protein n=1 Tax=Streptomyces adelaidensis TaxID=2796465 RepID=UPI0019039296|nr:DUF397 domain-containing protein [Streptomyces adelaidensis]
MSATELHWFKSSYSSSSDPNDCVEVAVASTNIHVRDSKTPLTPHLTLTPTAWTHFVAHAARA